MSMREKEDQEREDRIRDEAVVDAYGEEERAIGWYYYLEDRIHFPFRGRCIRRVSTLKEGNEIAVLKMADVAVCMHDMFVTVDNGEDTIDVPLAQIEPQNASSEAEKAIGDWHYWTARGYQF